MEEIKTLVTEKYELEHRDRSNLLETFVLLDLSTSDAKNKIEDFSFEHFTKSLKLSIQRLTGEMKLVFTKKEELEYRDNSLKMAFF